ncbi:MAG: hypothetical protein ACK2UK_19110 [Candidatus Promineifilaceae bacterium]
MKQRITLTNSRKVITLGGSMGGYGALLFGHMLQADEVHAFSPQSFLPSRQGRHLWKAMLARSWPLLRKQAMLRLDRQLDRRYFDLRPLLSDDHSTEYHVYFGMDNELDLAHGRHLAGLATVHLHAFENVGHHVARHLRSTGELDRILLKAMAFD